MAEFLARLIGATVMTFISSVFLYAAALLLPIISTLPLFLSVVAFVILVVLSLVGMLGTFSIFSILFGPMPQIDD